MIDKNVLAKAVTPSIAAARQDKKNQQQQRKRCNGTATAIPESLKDESDVAKARRMLQAAAPAAVSTIIDLSSNAETDRERLTAARDILDRNAIGKVLEGSNTATIPVAFLTAALAGIAFLAQRDMNGFGDMSNLNDALEAINVTPDRNTVIIEEESAL